MLADFWDVFYGGHALTNFNALLFQLIAKADEENLARLASGYPVQVALYRWWMAQKKVPDQKALIEQIRKLEEDERKLEGGSCG